MKKILTSIFFLLLGGGWLPLFSFIWKNEWLQFIAFLFQVIIVGAALQKETLIWKRTHSGTPYKECLESLSKNEKLVIWGAFISVSICLLVWVINVNFY